MKNLSLKPSGTPNPLAIAVQHHKSEGQIPTEMTNLWNKIRHTDLVEIENATHWNMNSKRMEIQARHGDILIALGGTEGVTYLANLYHDAGKPVIPLNMALTNANEGAKKLFAMGLNSRDSNQLFRTLSKPTHQWINKINFNNKIAADEKVKSVIDLLEDLEPPRAFAVRLLDPEHPEFKKVDDYFSSVIQPIVEGELGYKLIVVDGQNEFEYARIDEEIFRQLHRSSLVVADITGARPNCFIELGYSLGRGLPTIVTSLAGVERPFDITTISGLFWNTDKTVKERKQAFRAHYKAIRNRPPLVSNLPLIS